MKYDGNTTSGLSFTKVLKHIHGQEGLKKLTNMILDAFRGMICI